MFIKHLTIIVKSRLSKVVKHCRQKIAVHDHAASVKALLYSIEQRPILGGFKMAINR